MQPLNWDTANVKCIIIHEIHYISYKILVNSKKKKKTHIYIYNYIYNFFLLFTIILHEMLFTCISCICSCCRMSCRSRGVHTYIICDQRVRDKARISLLYFFTGTLIAFVLPQMGLFILPARSTD